MIPGLAATAALLLVAAVPLAIRLAPMRPTRWHTDPAQPARTGKPNDFLVTPFGAPSRGDAEAGVYALPAPALCRALQQAALRDPRTRLLAGNSAHCHITVICRSRLLAFPDAISIRTIALTPDTATFALHARARYGHSDFGVNRARTLTWLHQIAPFLSDPQPYC